MSTLILLNNAELPDGAASDALVAVWDKGSVPDGRISIPVELNERLLPIRDELAAWTYETGCVRVQGKLLEEHLRAGDNLSMWWCSTLVEKHPKVTHNLFPALKLRALEKLMEERGVTRLEVCKPAGTDPWMEDVLSRFCKETGRSFVLHVLPDGEPQPSGLKNRLKALYYRLPAPAKALLRFPAWLWIVRRRLPRTHVPRPAGRDEAREHRYLFPQHRHGRGQKRPFPLALLGKAPRRPRARRGGGSPGQLGLHLFPGPAMLLPGGREAARPFPRERTGRRVLPFP